MFPDSSWMVITPLAAGQRRDSLGDSNRAGSEVGGGEGTADESMQAGSVKEVCAPLLATISHKLRVVLEIVMRP